jgi:small multidrug resistance pump
MAILLEVSGTISMRQVHESEAWRAVAYVCYLSAFSLFPSILARIPLSVAYATWSAFGTAGVSAISVCVYGERLNARQALATITLVLSAILLW